MIQQQSQVHQTTRLLVRFYLFIKQRDAKIIELVFLGLYLWWLIVFSLPIDTYPSSVVTFIENIIPQTLIVFALTVVAGINFTALLNAHKYLRIVSACINVALMLILSTLLFLLTSPHAGTYGLFSIMAAFVCWKVNIREST